MTCRLLPAQLRHAVAELDRVLALSTCFARAGENRACARPLSCLPPRYLPPVPARFAHEVLRLAEHRQPGTALRTHGIDPAQVAGRTVARILGASRTVHHREPVRSTVSELKEMSRHGNPPLLDDDHNTRTEVTHDGIPRPVPQHGPGEWVGRRVETGPTGSLLKHCGHPESRATLSAESVSGPREAAPNNSPTLAASSPMVQGLDRNGTPASKPNSAGTSPAA